MKKYKWEIKLALTLIAISIVFYTIDYNLFGGPYKIYENILSQIAFLPIYVLFVTLVLEQIINKKEKQNLVSKMNVIIGLFFSEIGRELIKILVSYDNNFHNVRNNFTRIDKPDKVLMYYKSEISTTTANLSFLKEFMKSKKELLLNMMSNPNLLEHNFFTELMLSLFHLLEELEIRENIEKISEGDHTHINNDIDRAYMLLIKNWIMYMKHLKEEYPYLYSLEVRLNPFNIMKS